MPDHVKKIEVRTIIQAISKIDQKFKIIFENSKEEQCHKSFLTWPEAFAEGKKKNVAFGVFMRQYRIAAWNPEEGFYSFVAPELILQSEMYQARRRETNKKFN